MPPLVSPDSGLVKKIVMAPLVAWVWVAGGVLVISAGAPGVVALPLAGLVYVHS